MVSVFYTTKQTESGAFLRRVLTLYGLAEAEVKRSPHGKPYLPESPLKFSLTHSGAFTAVAVGEQELGLDAERQDRAPAPALLARLTPAEREEKFAEVWTAKEAYIKYRGGTLAAMLPRLTFEKGILCEDGMPLPVRLTFATLEGFILCLCTKSAEEVRAQRL